ncbi:MFS transporter [Microbacterium lacus]|uniref:MFS transporter n=2 Tax=Microbacterium lacus TaxID=415217 RepID=A0ABP4SZF4_9MICO
MFTLVVPIQARLPELLDSPRHDTAWVVTATLLSAAVITPIAGRLGDMYGKRRVILGLIAAMVLGSVIAALSQEIIGIVIGRSFQGAIVGAVPLGISIMRDVLHTDRVNAAVAFMSATLGMGGALGLPISAIVTQTLDWHMLFWMAAILGTVVFVLVLLVVPVSVLRTGGRFDVIGTIGIAVGLVALMLAISRGNEWGWTSLWTMGLGLGGIVVLVLWGVYELRVEDPLLDLRVASRPSVLLTNIASVAIGFALFASNVIYPQLLELPIGSGVGFGLSLLASSLIVMPSGLMMLLLSPVAGRIGTRAGPKLLMIIGTAALTLAYGFTMFFMTEVWHIFIANVLVGVAIGFGYASMPMLIMRSVPHTETGASNGLNALFRSIGTATAAALVAAVLAGYSVDFQGVEVPTAHGIRLALVLGGGAALVALLTASFIPARPAPGERSPSLPV